MTDFTPTDIQAFGRARSDVVDSNFNAAAAAIASKANAESPTFTGTVVLPATTSIGNTTSAEIGYINGVTSSIQSQINAEIAARIAADNAHALLASPSFTGTPSAPTATTGTSTTQLATTAFVTATAFSPALPAQTGNAGKFVTTDGTNASWAAAATLAANTFTGPQNFARATVASHATAADIWSVGNTINWTGTVTASAFPAAPQAGAERTLICAGICGFTVGANMLIDGGNSIVCAVNDIVIVRAISTTQFRLTRIKYSGTAEVGPTIGKVYFLGDR